MPTKRKWTKDGLEMAVKEAKSYRQVLARIGLIEAGGNYRQVKKYIREYGLDISHFLGKGWSRGMDFARRPAEPLLNILVANSDYQTFKLKRRLFKEGLKLPQCEECGWAKKSEDGRLPLELDHINGDSRDHRIQNLRVLCPNCHSLKPTHRGANRKNKGR